MKKIILILSIALNSLLASGQALTYLDLPVIGELWIEFKDTLGSNISISPPGAGQTWNFLNSFTVHDTIQYLPQMPASVPSAVANLFPTATSADAGEAPGEYTFYKTDLTGMYVDGYYSTQGFDVSGFTVNDKNYSSDLLYIPVPFDTGYVVQNTSVYSYIYPDPSLMPDALVKVTYSTFQDMEAEAQGTLTTPLGTYNSVIRVKEMLTNTILYEIDSFALGNFTYLTDFPSPTAYAYKWFKQGPNCLVMTATLDEFQNVTEASYFTSSGLVGSNSQSSNNFVLYPNPVSQGSNLNISIKENTATTIIFYDLTGREVYQSAIPLGASIMNVNTNILEPGLYYANLINNRKIETVLKFTVVK